MSDTVLRYPAREWRISEGSNPVVLKINDPEFGISEHFGLESLGQHTRFEVDHVIHQYMTSGDISVSLIVSVYCKFMPTEWQKEEMEKRTVKRG